MSDQYYQLQALVAKAIKPYMVMNRCKSPVGTKKKKSSRALNVSSRYNIFNIGDPYLGLETLNFGTDYTPYTLYLSMWDWYLLFVILSQKCLFFVVASVNMITTIDL